MGFIQILILLWLVWVLVIGLVVGLCRSAQRGDRLIEEEIPIESLPARRFSSTA